MCRELESIGLPDPVFNNNTFSLKTTVMSSTWQNLPIGTGKPAVSLSGGMGMPAKLPFESFVQAYLNKGYKESTPRNLKAIYDQIETNQVFGSAYLVKILECPERTARGLLAKLREMDVVVAVTGKGKGMYRLKNAGE